MAKGYPVLALTGPRQSGKTTLARATFSRKPYVSLEEQDRLENASSDPRGFLSLYPDGAVIDEAQRCPPLFSYIQTLVDLDGRMGLYVLTGSQQFGLMSKITQSLAGRVALISLLPFSVEELAEAGREFRNLDDLLVKGLYPALYDRDLEYSSWHANYLSTYVERDVRQILNVGNLGTFRKFLRLCAGRVGQMVNLSGLAIDCGITHNTARSWLAILEASYIVFLLPPYFRNFGKRLVKTPKLYFFDTGLACWLLGIRNPKHLSLHPMRGPLFESFVISELIKARFHAGQPHDLYFWRDRSGHEVDLVVDMGVELVPVEIKSGKTVTQEYFIGLTKWEAITGQKSSKRLVVFGGDESRAQQGFSLFSWRDLTKAAKEIR